VTEFTPADEVGADEVGAGVGVAVGTGVATFGAGVGSAAY
jgi:hypothetical protein